jgi:hypothetical protein
MIDPKPARRIRDPFAGRDKLLREARCRSCGRPSYGQHGLTRHHLVGRGVGGDDVEENLVPLCGDGTLGCHGALTDHRRGWREVARRLRANLRDEEIDYILQKKSHDWLDRTYPERTP